MVSGSSLCVLCSLQNRINAPPEIVDFQEVPKSVERLMKLNQALKDGRMQTKKRRMKKKKQKNKLINTENLIGKEIILPGMTKADKPTQSFAQKPGETDSQFLHRIDEACHVSYCYYCNKSSYNQSIIYQNIVNTSTDFV